MTEPEKAKLKRDIYFIADHYGTLGQLNKTIEECTELVAAIIGYIHKQDSRAHIAEEIADVLISVNAMVGAYDLETYVKEWLDRKYERNQDTYR